jgi:hypothetical protein
MGLRKIVFENGSEDGTGSLLALLLSALNFWILLQVSLLKLVLFLMGLYTHNYGQKYCCKEGLC